MSHSFADSHSSRNATPRGATPPRRGSPPRAIASPPANSSGVGGEATSAATVMHQVLDQMERCFQTDHNARRERIQQLEARQRELEDLCRHVERDTQLTVEESKLNEQSDRQHLQREVTKYSAQCDASLAQLVEDCKLANEEKKRLQGVNENLDVALKRQREANVQQQKKVEQLARNVVKAMKERTTILDELDTMKATLESSTKDNHVLRLAQVERDEAKGVVSSLQAERDTFAKQHELAELEIKRLTTLLDKQTQDEQNKRRDLVESNDKVLSQVTEQLTDVSAEKEILSTSLGEAQLTNDRLAEELKQMLASRRERDERVASLEKELIEERTRRLSLERQINTAVEKRNQAVLQSGIVGSSPAADVGDLYEARKEIVRLEALLDRATLESADSLKHSEQRIQHLSNLYEQALERCQGYERSLLDLRQQVALVTRERMKHALVSQTLRQRILQLQADGANTAASIVTSKSDVEEAVANATNELTLRFAQQIHKDFAAIAYFFVQLKTFDVESMIKSAGQSSGASGTPAGLLAPGFSSPERTPMSMPTTGGGGNGEGMTPAQSWVAPPPLAPITEQDPYENGGGGRFDRPLASRSTSARVAPLLSPSM